VGLDCWFERARPGGPFPHVGLASALLAGGEGAFRGRIYADLVEKATGQSLYRNEIGPEDVARMATGLEEFARAIEGLRGERELPGGWRYAVTAADARDLAALFRHAASEGMALMARW